MNALGAFMLSTALTITSLALPSQDNNTPEKLQARNAPSVFIYSASAFGPDKNGDSTFTIEVGNTGGKTIAAIEWEYNVSQDLAGVARKDDRTFRNEKLKLDTQERSKLTRRVQHYTDRFIRGFNLSTVRITQVEFEDGSSWKRTGDPQ